MSKAKVIVTMLCALMMVVAPALSVSTNAQSADGASLQADTAGIARAQVSKYNTLGIYYDGVHVASLTHNSVWETWKRPKSQTLIPTFYKSGYSVSSIAYRYQNYSDYTAAWVTADVYKGSTYMGKATMTFFCDQSMTFATDKVFEPY